MREKHEYQPRQVLQVFYPTLPGCKHYSVRPKNEVPDLGVDGFMGLHRTVLFIRMDGLHDFKVKIDCIRYIPIPVAGHFLDVWTECSRCSFFCFVAWLLRSLNFDIFARIWRYPVPCYLCNF